MFELIKELTELTGPVGQEEIVLAHMESLWRQLGADVSRTRIGNLIARAGGEGPRIALIAHADELCFLVRAIDDNGFLFLANGQNWQRSAGLRNGFTIGQRVKVLGRKATLPGVIAAATGHLASIALPEPNELNWNDFWVDTCLTRQEILQSGVTPGTRVIWDGETVLHGRNIVGKALDDRVPLAIISEVMRRVPVANRTCDLTAICTVQEEIGVVGASALAQHGPYDAAIILEIGMAGDIPGVGLRDMPLRLGAGPALIHKDSLVHYDHALTAQLEAVASDAGIPIQHAVFGSFGSDGSALMRADIPAALVAFPARYTHTPFETGNLDDIEAMVAWMCALVTRKVKNRAG
jgi:putative aminopeptidase FrvX